MAEKSTLLANEIALAKTGSASPKSESLPEYEAGTPHATVPSPTSTEKAEEKYSNEVIQRMAYNREEYSEDVDSQILNSISDINNNDWKTPGDRELRRIKLSSGDVETLYLTPDKYHHKKLFVSFLVDDVCVNTENETVLSIHIIFFIPLSNIFMQFRMKFCLQFNWIPSESDYRRLYKKTREAAEQKNSEILNKWRPEWYPELEIENATKIHSMKYMPHPKLPQKGLFRIGKYFKYGNGSDPINKLYQKQDFERIKWFCAELECDITFREELEIQSYPFDVQDLSCCMRIKSNDTINYAVFPLPNYFNSDATTSQVAQHENGGNLTNPSLIGSFDPTGSQLDEWDVENSLIEFQFSKIVLSIKLSRRYQPVLINTLLIQLLMSLLSFTVFSVDFEDTASRLELTMTLILTAVLFDTQTSPKPYLTFLDKYILSSYLFLTLVMMENALAGWFDADFAQDFDNLMFFVIAFVFVVQHTIFFGYAYGVRQRERQKIFMGYDEVQKFNEKYEKERKKYLLYENEVKSRGGNKYKRCLALSGIPWQ